MSSSAPHIHMPHWPTPLWREPVGFSLERMAELLRRLGNPQNDLPPVVQVAGTNGKGSSIAFLRAMLEAAGYAVHAYTSPHLHRFEERIRLRGELIGERELFQALETARAACGDDLAVTFFEGTTAAAYLAMAQIPADIALIETGMGGRDDPTNILPTAIVSIITTIDYDHTEFLGSTLAGIAAHKAGILKPSVPAIIAPQLPEALAVIETHAAGVGAPLLIHGRDWAAEMDAEGLIYADAHGQVLLPCPALPGAHQATNAGAAIAALTVLEDFAVDQDAVQRGLAQVEWPGRLEKITQGSIAALLPEGWELWLDGGHNPAGARALADHIAQTWHDRLVHLIFGTTRGKELSAMLAPLLPHVASVTAVPVRAEPKSYSAEEIARVEAGIRIASSVAEAVAEIAESKSPSNILIFGSLYLRVETVA